MAVGYSHVSTVKTLLDAGANPEIPDNQGRNVVQLVDSIRDQMPLSPQLAGKRIALEEVSGLLTGAYHWVYTFNSIPSPVWTRSVPLVLKYGQEHWRKALKASNV